MYDLHAHILPGVDDGPRSWDQAVSMLAAAERDGIKGIVATPHFTPGLYDNPGEKVVGLVDELKRRADGMRIEIYPGSELTVSVEALAGIGEGRLCSINSGRYVLIELPASFSPRTVYDFISGLTSGGFVPIIAHPERNRRVTSNMDMLYEMVRMGALGQVTAGSLTGQFGSEVKRAAGRMLESRLVHVIASDAHSEDHRPPTLSAGLKAAAKISGEEAAAYMAGEAPKKILDNQPLTLPEPVHHKPSFKLF